MLGDRPSPPTRAPSTPMFTTLLSCALSWSTVSDCPHGFYIPRTHSAYYARILHITHGFCASRMTRPFCSAPSSHLFPSRLFSTCLHPLDSSPLLSPSHLTLSHLTHPHCSACMYHSYLHSLRYLTAYSPLRYGPFLGVDLVLREIMVYHLLARLGFDESTMNASAAG